MNNKHELYNEYLKITTDWPLDDWSITKECFDNIVEILPFNSTILEIGSGNSTDILSRFYNMISVESNKTWLNKFKSKYYYIEEVEIDSVEFGRTLWLNPDKIINMLKEIDYDMLIVDAGGRRVGIYDYIDNFKTNVPIIFDDTMEEDAHANDHLICANLISNKLNKNIKTIRCKVNKYCVHWYKGKQYSIII